MSVDDGRAALFSNGMHRPLQSRFHFFRAMDGLGQSSARRGGNAGMVRRRLEADPDVGALTCMAFGMNGGRRKSRRAPAAVVVDHLQERCPVAFCHPVYSGWNSEQIRAV